MCVRFAGRRAISRNSVEKTSDDEKDDCCEGRPVAPARGKMSS